MQGFDSAAMSPEQRLREIAAILARGILRLRRCAPKNSLNLPTTALTFPANRGSMCPGVIVTDQAELARLGNVSRARLTQIMNLLKLAPDIQEAILHLPCVESGRELLTERDLRPIVAEVDWGRQREMWESLGVG